MNRKRPERAFFFYKFYCNLVYFKKNESVGMGKNIAIKMNNNIAESISKQVNLFFSDLKKYLNGIDVFSGNDDW